MPIICSILVNHSIISVSVFSRTLPQKTFLSSEKRYSGLSELKKYYLKKKKEDMNKIILKYNFKASQKKNDSFNMLLQIFWPM